MTEQSFHSMRHTYRSPHLPRPVLVLVLALALSFACEKPNTAPLIKPVTFTIEENSPTGTLVGTIIASDAENNALSYRIMTGNAGYAFALDSINGELRVNDGSALDFERRPEYLLTVGVSDGELETQAEVRVSISDLLLEPGEYAAAIYEKHGSRLPYRILVPPGYENTNNLPLLFFLHGSGERGNDNKSQLEHGGKLFRDSIEIYPSIVVFPQCASDETWSTSPPYPPGGLDDSYPSVTLLEDLIDSLSTLDMVDPDRIFVSGLSMGGFGTGQLLAKYPGRFAAAAIICGGGPLEYDRELAMTPTWLFHGLDDNVVPPDNSQLYFAAIDDGSGKHRQTLYPGVGHVSWDLAFAEPDFLSWLFAH